MSSVSNISESREPWFMENHNMFRACTACCGCVPLNLETFCVHWALWDFSERDQYKSRSAYMSTCIQLGSKNVLSPARTTKAT